MRETHEDCKWEGLIGYRFVQGGVEFDHLIKNFGATVTGKDGFNAEGGYIIPGLVDIHTHGAMGADASDASPEGLKRLACYYAANGVTGWLPTTMTLPEPEMVKALESIRDFTRPINGAKVFGVHLEDAVYAASTAPARVIGAEKAGSIEVGHSADLVVLDEQLQVKAVYVDGERVEV